MKAIFDSNLKYRSPSLKTGNLGLLWQFPFLQCGSFLFHWTSMCNSCVAFRIQGIYCFYCLFLCSSHGGCIYAYHNLLQFDS